MNVGTEMQKLTKWVLFLFKDKKIKTLGVLDK